MSLRTQAALGDIHSRRWWTGCPVGVVHQPGDPDERPAGAPGFIGESPARPVIQPVTTFTREDRK